MMTNHKLTISPQNGLTLEVEGEYTPGRAETLEQPRIWPEFEFKSADLVMGDVLDLIEWVSDQKDVWGALQDLCLTEIEKQP